VTFRLYDWDRIDAKTGRRRPLQVNQALACIDFSQGAVDPVAPLVEKVESGLRERLFLCKYFELWRQNGKSPFTVGKAGEPQVLVCTDGDIQLEYEGINYVFGKGEVLILPVVIGACLCKPSGFYSLMEISLQKGA